MRLHLVLAGLLWPAPHAGQPARDLRLPGLETLLGKGRMRLSAGESPERGLARLFGLAGEPPAAALRLLGETPPVEPAAWLCADPVHLSFAREHLLLDELADGELSAEEAAALVSALNEQFSGMGHFIAPAPGRWYLRPEADTATDSFVPLADAAGRPLAAFLPQGPDGLPWQRWMNEAQVLLHNHPVNQARTAVGLRVANSLWFWGAGPLPEHLAAPMQTVQADETFARGLARAAGMEAGAPDFAAALRQDTLVVIDRLRRPVRRLDLDGWRDALAALEHDWFAPLAAALRGGRLRELRLTAPGDRHTLELQITPGSRWRFWRRPRPFSALLQSAAPPLPTLPAQPPAS